MRHEIDNSFLTVILKCRNQCSMAVPDKNFDATRGSGPSPVSELTMKQAEQAEKYRNEHDSDPISY
jgi:hypothetical protein